MWHLPDALHDPPQDPSSASPTRVDLVYYLPIITMTHQFEALAGFATAGISALALWLADAAPENLSTGLQAGGTVGLIGGLSVALVVVWRNNMELVKALRESEAARLLDQKDANRQYRADADAGEHSRQELIRELRTQTEVIKRNAP